MMSKMAIAACGALMCCLSQVGAAGAASLSGVQGEVLVNAGQGLKPVTGAANLKAGDIVIAQKGSAKLIYPDGCTINIDPGASATISEKSPCAAQASTQTGQVAAAAPAAAGLSTTALVVGGLAIAGGVALAASQKDGNKKSASP
jgi:hypothetical protein